MKKHTVDIRAGMLFPLHFLILGGIFLFAGLIVAATNLIVTAVLVFVALFILTAYEGTEIDTSARTLREYYAFLFLKTGKTRRYKGIEGISIHRAKVTQKLFTARTLSSSTFTHTEFNAYLKLYGDEKVFLLSEKNKEKLLRKVGSLARRLDTSVADHAVFP